MKRDAEFPAVSASGRAIAAALCEPPADASLPAMIGGAAERFATQTAFTTVMPNGMYGSLSFARVNAMADAFAVYLREVAGVAPGTRVAVQVPNSLVVPVAVFGTLKAGCVLVNTNPLYTPSEMEHQFRDSGAQVLVIADLFVDKLDEIAARTQLKHVLVCSVSSFFPPLVRDVVHGVMKHWNRLVRTTTVPHSRFEAAIATGSARLRERSIDVRAYWRDLAHADLACLQYTGGTTGVSKGAMLTHGNLLWNVEQILSVGKTKIEDGRECILTALPLYHVFAFTVNLLAFFRAGARNILVPSPRPIQNLQRAVENYPVSWLVGVNTLYNALLNEEWFVAYPPKHIKAAIGGGAAMHRAVVQRWGEVTGTRLIEGYGLTESSPVVTFQPLEGKLKTDTIGVPAPGTEIRLVDDAGVEVAAGSPGELLVRGPQVMRGYWNQPEETAKVLRDGWLATGDIAVRDEDGFYRIVDRKKDLIIVSGFNVYPNEIEDVLTRHDKVLEAAVIGVPDARTGEAVRAYVVKRDPSLVADDLVAHCRGVLTGYKMPARIEFVDELPKTPIGKILRKELRKRVMEAKA